MLPPLAAALTKFTQEYEYSWHTPGHAGGTAFLKSPVGRIFFDYFGENLLRSDLSISVGDLGSLLDHSGPIGEHEKYAARVFGAHRTYCVTNGTSTSNRMIFTAAVGRDQIALCDRNCHKSIEHGLVMTGGIPTYLVPLRNRYGIIGPIPPARLDKDAIAPRSRPTARHKRARTSGPCTRSSRIPPTTGSATTRNASPELLDPSVDRIHFDEAWYAYARFNPIYRDRHAMQGDPKDHTGPTVFATHSTHKLLAALSQASLLHIRDGRSPIPHERFNESFMMHCVDLAALPDHRLERHHGRDDGSAWRPYPHGRVDCGSGRISPDDWTRQPPVREKGRLVLQYLERGPGEGDEEGPPNSPSRMRRQNSWLLIPSAWVHAPRRTLARVRGSRRRLRMLDPIKVSVVTPGVADSGGLDKRGIPATLVTAYLHHRGVEVEKTTDFTVLFLFSIGITKGKWGTLLNALLEFKRDYDANVPLAEVLPDAREAVTPMPTARSGSAILSDQMFGQLKETRQTHWLAQAFSTLPTPLMTPEAAYQHLVRGNIEHVALENLADRVLATSVVPYPPGIPMLMPGETTGAADGPYLSYLRALSAWDRRFPGFGHDTHGVENREGAYYVQCLKKGATAKG